MHKGQMKKVTHWLTHLEKYFNPLEIKKNVNETLANHKK